MYQKEFNLTERPCTVPSCLFGEGWKDVSWHNNACPSFENQTLCVIVWVDFDNPDHREWPSSTRLDVYRVDEEGVTYDSPQFCTDDGDELAAFLETLKK